MERKPDILSLRLRHSLLVPGILITILFISGGFTIMSDKTILAGFTPDQVSIIRDAVYQISDAYQSLNSLHKDMTTNNQWQGWGDIEHISSVIDRHLTGDHGCINHLLRIL